MAAFIPYTEASTLPKRGDFEFDTRDFKGTIFERDGSIDRLELAKDMAAFANAHGGTILVGAYEDTKRGHLGAIKGMIDEDVKRVRDAYSQGASQLCRPSPVVNSVVIEHSTGKVVAVNVSPFPGQAVGIKVDPDTWNTWRFPVRRSIETIFFTSEQLPMLMIPELRRVVALLRSIAPKDRIKMRYEQGSALQPTRYLTVLNEEENTVVFSKEPGGKEALREPLDRVIHVWKSTPSSWCVMFKRL